MAKLKGLASPKLWEEGKYLDFWSVIHFLSGVLLGILFGMLNITFLPALLLIIMLGIIFEVIEYFILGIETFPNKVVDVIISTIGFLIAFLLLPKSLLLFLILLVVWIILNIIGWIAILFKDGKIYKKIRNKFLRNLCKFFSKKKRRRISQK